MKYALRFAALIAFLVLLPNANAKDATGTWKGAFDFQGTSVPLVFHLSSAAGVVTGTIEGLPVTPTEIHEGKSDGDTVTFWINTDYEGTTYKIVFKGKLGDGEIDFSFGTEDGSWGADLVAKNSEATPAVGPAATPATPAATPATAPVAAPAAVDVTGNWKAAFDFQGTSVPLVFHLAAKEGVVTGTIEGLATTPTEIHDGKVDGDTITFWFNSDYAGTTYKIVGKGKVTADGISLAIGTEDGAWGTDITATKVI
jgi:hypothetical protein